MAGGRTHLPGQISFASPNPGRNLCLRPRPRAAAATGISGFSLSGQSSGTSRPRVGAGLAPRVAARAGSEGQGCRRPPRPVLARHGAAMPRCLLWVCLAVWEARGDFPLIADNDATLTVNW